MSHIVGAIYYKKIHNFTLECRGVATYHWLSEEGKKSVLSWSHEQLMDDPEWELTYYPKENNFDSLYLRLK